MDSRRYVYDIYVDTYMHSASLAIIIAEIVKFV